MPISNTVDFLPHITINCTEGHVLKTLLKYLAHFVHFCIQNREGSMSHFSAISAGLSNDNIIIQCQDTTS